MNASQYSGSKNVLLTMSRLRTGSRLLSTKFKTLPPLTNRFSRIQRLAASLLSAAVPQGPSIILTPLPEQTYTSRPRPPLREAN